MNSINNFLHKQCHFLLQNELYALLLVVILALTPVTLWLSLTVITLITLRKSRYTGIKVLLSGMTAAMFAANHTQTLPYAVPAILTTFLLSYIAAILLRITERWTVVTEISVAVALIGLVITQGFFPGYITNQFQLLLLMFKSTGQGSLMLSVLEGKQGINQGLLANYLLGIKSLSIVFSALFSVMLARYLQSILFYPEGFRKEIMAFRASPAGVVLLVICVFGMYQNNAIAISCLPILVSYLLIAGINVTAAIMVGRKTLYSLFFIVISLIIMPYIMLPVYVLLGSLDSLFDFRLRLLVNFNSEKANKRHEE